MKKQTKPKSDNPPGRQKANLSATLHQWSTEAGIDSETLLRWLIKAGFDYKPGEVIHGGDIIMAIRGDDKTERTALVRSQRELNEIEKAEKEKILVNRADVETELWDMLAPFKASLFKLAERKGFTAELDAVFAEHFKKTT